MPKYEYKVVPAPKKPGKIKGVRGTDAKFAAELARLMNEFGQDGWEYQRTDTLPCEERQGLTGRTTVFQNMLVFRREINDLAEKPAAATQPPETPRVEAENVLAVPVFRSPAAEPTLPRLTAVPGGTDSPAPAIGAPRRPDTDIAAQ